MKRFRNHHDWLLLLGLGLLLLTATAAPAAAKSNLTVTTNLPLTTSGNTRNYLPTGTDDLYSKLPISKTTKVQTKAAVLKNLKNASDSGQTYFRGYRAAKLSNGKWYLKVVSFDKTYRGWIYTGTTDPTNDPTQVSGGLQAVQTFKEQTVPDYVATTTFYFTTPKASTLTYVAPDYTDYKVGRNLNATTDFYQDPLTVTKVGSKQNGRSANLTYYYVNDAAHPQVNGWVRISDVSTSPAS